MTRDIQFNRDKARAEPKVVLRMPRDTTKGHRHDEKQNLDEQAAHGNLRQNTSNRRSG